MSTMQFSKHRMVHTDDVNVSTEIRNQFVSLEMAIEDCDVGKTFELLREHNPDVQGIVMDIDGESYVLLPMEVEHGTDRVGG